MLARRTGTNNCDDTILIICEDYFDKAKGTTGNQYCEINFWVKPDNICEEAKMSMQIENAGGESEISEMYSIHYFSENYSASDFIFEEQVNYWIRYKKVDFICNIKIAGENERVGVSVTRAMAYPTFEDFTEEKAYRLLDKKLLGLIVANNSLDEKERYLSSFLHIWCQDISMAQTLKTCYEKMNFNDYNLDYHDITLIITVTNDPCIYQNTL